MFTDAVGCLAVALLIELTNVDSGDGVIRYERGVWSQNSSSIIAQCCSRMANKWMEIVPSVWNSLELPNNKSWKLELVHLTTLSSRNLPQLKTSSFLCPRSRASIVSSWIHGDFHFTEVSEQSRLNIAEYAKTEPKPSRSRRAFTEFVQPFCMLSHETKDFK